jgi:AcrR family transcriptional regulator
MLELAGDARYERVTVRSLTRTAGVSSRTFYRHFPNREECLASTIDSVGHEFLCRATRTKVEAAGWHIRIRAALASLFGDLATQPKAARVLLVESLSAGRPARARARELTADLERLLAHLLATSPVAADPPRQVVAGIAAGIVRVATTTTLTGRAEELAGISVEVGNWVVAIYDKEVVTLSATERESDRRRRREASPLPAEMSSIAGHGDHERILAAVSRLATEGGFGALSVPKIRREAGVSRRAFDARFGDATECFLEAVESLARTAAKKAEAWASASRAGGDRSYRRILALCAIAARNRSLARLVLAQILAPGREGLLRRERLISAAVERLAEQHAPRTRTSEVGLEASVAAAWRIAEDEVLTDDGRRLPEVARLLSGLCAVRVSC